MTPDLESRLRDLGEFIRDQRRTARLSLRKLSELAGISNPYLSQIERGLREPSERVVDAIARSLETSVDALYADAGISIPEEEDAGGAREAIEVDDRLTARQRRTLLEMYDSFLALNGRARESGSSRRS